jgi:hypothetical protein
MGTFWSSPPPEDHYVWRPGAAPPRPPRARWPKVLGVLIAIGAQGTLYLGLRHMSIATMPAWAHLHAVRPMLPYPAIVPVDLVHDTRLKAAVDQAAVEAAPALPAPVMQPPPVVTLEAPEVGR